MDPLHPNQKFTNLSVLFKVDKHIKYNNECLLLCYCCFMDDAIFFRISLLAYSPLAMGILSGKYFSPEGGPADARLHLFRGIYKMLPFIIFSDHKPKGNCYRFIRCRLSYVN